MVTQKVIIHLSQDHAFYSNAFGFAILSLKGGKQYMFTVQHFDQEH